MTIKTNANCKLLAKCCQPTKTHASAGHPPPTARITKAHRVHSPRPTAQQQQQQQLVVSMRVALLHDHKLQAGRPALLRATRTLHEHYQLCQGTRTTHTHRQKQHTHTHRSTHSLTHSRLTTSIHSVSQHTFTIVSSWSRRPAIASQQLAE